MRVDVWGLFAGNELVRVKNRLAHIWGRRRLLIQEQIGRAIGMLALAVLLSACDWRGSAELRYRITVEIDTPDGIRRGSSVWSFSLRPGNLTSAYESDFKGEAVAVDLPGGKAVYVLLAGRRRNGEIMRSVAPVLPEVVYRRAGLTRDFEREVGGDRMRVLRYIQELPRRPIALDCPNTMNSFVVECLQLAYLRDPANPSTVRAIDYNQLESVFGSGIRLRSITLEITDESTSFVLQDRLPWLMGSPETRLDQAVEAQGNQTFAASLTNGDFQRK